MSRDYWVDTGWGISGPPSGRQLQEAERERARMLDAMQQLAMYGAPDFAAMGIGIASPRNLKAVSPTKTTTTNKLLLLEDV